MFHQIQPTIQEETKEQVDDMKEMIQQRFPSIQLLEMTNETLNDTKH